MDHRLSSGEGHESDIVFYRDGECIYNVQCTPLLDAVDKRLGGLVVIVKTLPDWTRKYD